jgi:hypothetical protein
MLSERAWVEGSNNDNNNGNEKRERKRERKTFFCGLGLERSDLNRVGEIKVHLKVKSYV